MKLQIKTLSQKTLLIEIDETKTVYDLKKELSLYPDIGVQPELQKIIYSGKILQNNEPLSMHKIDIKKFLVVMILKQPVPEETAITTSTSLAEPMTTTQPNADSTKIAADGGNNKAKVNEAVGAAAATSSASASAVAVEASKITTNEENKSATGAKTETDEMVERIVSMGYEEADVRRALAASFNNAERAIEYLIEGTPFENNDNSIEFDDMDADASPFEIFRNDPVFRQLRSAIQQHPELITAAIQRIGEANPAILNLINENQQDFLNALMDSSDNETDDNEET